jgi:hypothetical protein
MRKACQRDLTQLVFKGKIGRNTDHRKPTRTNNDALFSLRFLAGLGWFRLEFQHKTSTVLAKELFPVEALFRQSVLRSLKNISQKATTEGHPIFLAENAGNTYFPCRGVFPCFQWL